MRTAEVRRDTRETRVEITLNLDGSGDCELSTGIGFLDHMLRHVAVHGLFDLSVHADGDLEVDPTSHGRGRRFGVGDCLRPGTGSAERDREDGICLCADG